VEFILRKGTGYTVKLPSVLSGPHAPRLVLKQDREALKRVANINRNGWPLSLGIGGRIASEYAATVRVSTVEEKTTV